MTYQIPARPADQVATSVTAKELDQVERVFDLLLAPMVLPEGEVSVVIERVENTQSMIISLLHVRGVWLIEKERNELAAIGVSLTGLDKVLWQEPMSIITIHPRGISAHDAIQDRAVLKSICEDRGLSWIETSQCYDAILRRVFKERGTA